MSTHSSHSDIVKRLKRADGHLKSTILMLEEDRPCLQIAQQLHAVERAIAAAKKLLVHDHIDHCLEEAIGENVADVKALEEFKQITKYL